MHSGDLEELRNLGVLRLGGPVPEDQRTIIVLGVARSGTSMVASVLRQLGVFMGAEAVPPVYEDVRLAKAIETGAQADARRVVAEYNETHATWGFKRPGALGYLNELSTLVRTPIYVVVFRDPLAIANRNAISMRADPLRSIHQTLKQYAVLHDFLVSQSPVALLVSNEKALLKPDVFVQQVVDWLGLDVPQQQRDRAAACILVDTPQYLDASRLKFLGHLDRATAAEVSGWAYVQGQGGPARVEVLVNGRVIGTAVADRQRADVRRRGVHPTGFCGFRFEMGPDALLATDDEVAVRFSVGAQHLKGSPRRVA